MKRRDFLAASAAAGVLVGARSTGVAPAAEGEGGRRKLLELRVYRFASDDKLKAFDSLLSKTVVPAINRAGVKPVGVFRLAADDNPKAPEYYKPPVLFVLLPYNSPQELLMLMGRMVEDPDVRSGVQEYLAAPMKDPAFDRFDSSLLLAFEQAPRVEAPVKGEGRLFQLRIYESHNEERAMRKIQMFNEGGEIGIFRRVGMTPVFFGQSLVGRNLPNLTYMLGFESKEAQDKAWGAFRNNPDWQKLSKDEEYKDTVSNITNLILRPAASSQI
jgi:hypothetical protein